MRKQAKQTKAELRCKLPAKVIKEINRLIARDGLGGRSDLLVAAIAAYSLYRQPFDQ